MSNTISEKLRTFNEKYWCERQEPMKSAMDLISDAANEIDKLEIIIGDYTKAFVESVKNNNKNAETLSKLNDAVRKELRKVENDKST